MVANVSDVVLDGYAGKITDLLAQSSQTVVKGSLARIGRADNGDGSISSRDRFVFWPRHGMARHGRASVALITESRCAASFHATSECPWSAHRDLRPFDPIDPGIAART